MTYQSGELIFDKYRIETILGKSVLGEVYRITHLNLNVQRVLKVFTHNGNGIGSIEFNNIRQRFKLETQLGARLNSPFPNPHLLQVYDFYETNNVLMLEMEYAHGGNLSDQINIYKSKSIPFPKEKALKIAFEIASGLTSLHELNIVHRDLKPANILFDKKDNVRIADLGLAQIPGGPNIHSILSNPNPHPGTPGYMSPEQRQSSALLMPSSDIFALGLILFEMLNGQNYYMVRRNMRLSDLIPGIKPTLNDLLYRMLSELPGNRPSNGKDVAVELYRELVLEEQSLKAIQDKKRREMEEWERLKKEELSRQEGKEFNRQDMSNKETLDSEKKTIFELEEPERYEKQASPAETEKRAEIPPKDHQAAIQANNSLEGSGEEKKESTDCPRESIKPPSIWKKYWWFGIPILLGIAVIPFLNNSIQWTWIENSTVEPAKTIEVTTITKQVSTQTPNEKWTVSRQSSTPATIQTQTESQTQTQTESPTLTETQAFRNTQMPTVIPTVLPEIMVNPGFEDSSGWINKMGDSHIIGQYSSDWASQGKMSFKISLFGDKSYEYCFTPGMRTTINQTVDLTNVNEMFFDLNIKPAVFQTGSHGDNEKAKAVVFIDKDQIHTSGEGVFGEIPDQQLIFNNRFSGRHEIKFGLMVMSKFCVKGNSESESLSLYVDNIRFVYR